jgi:hypothetical protein
MKEDLIQKILEAKKAAGTLAPKCCLIFKN